jgi:hypothetical protein
LFTGTALLSLLISALAPGNAVRQEVFGQSNPIFWSIGTAIGLALDDLSRWTSPVLLLLVICAVPLIWRYAKNSSFSFPYPLLVLALSFLMFASQNFPPLYAMGHSGDFRIRNIVYYSYLWLIFGNAFYLIGWLNKRFEIRPRFKICCDHAKIAALITIPLIALVFLLGYNTSNTAHSIRDLRSGSPQRFLAEHNERQALLLDTSQQTVALPSFTAYPRTLVPWHDGIRLTDVILTENPNAWRNQMIAAYYGKESVVSLPAENVIANRTQVPLQTKGRTTYLEALRINEQHFFRLRDIAYILGDVFDVDFADGEWIVRTNQRYTIVGGEGRQYQSDLGPEPATIYSTTLLFDDTPKPVLSYIVRDEIFYRLQDIAKIIDMQLQWRDGSIIVSW